MSEPFVLRPAAYEPNTSRSSPESKEPPSSKFLFFSFARMYAIKALRSDMSYGESDIYEKCACIADENYVKSGRSKIIFIFIQK
jgi:hypothetical protein